MEEVTGGEAEAETDFMLIGVDMVGRARIETSSKIFNCNKHAMKTILLTGPPSPVTIVVLIAFFS